MLLIPWATKHRAEAIKQGQISKWPSLWPAMCRPVLPLVHSKYHAMPSAKALCTYSGYSTIENFNIGYAPPRHAAAPAVMPNLARQRPRKTITSHYPSCVRRKKGLQFSKQAITVFDRWFLSNRISLFPTRIISPPLNIMLNIQQMPSL